MVTGRKLHKDVGQRVKALRVAQGLTQGDLAARMHLDETTVRSIEAGRRGMSLDTLMRLAAELRVHPGSVLGQGGDGAGPPSEAAILVRELPAEWQAAAVRVLRDIHATVLNRAVRKKTRAR